jgi:hypothetical protein
VRYQIKKGTAAKSFNWQAMCPKCIKIAECKEYHQAIGKFADLNAFTSQTGKQELTVIDSNHKYFTDGQTKHTPFQKTMFS